MNFLAGAVRPDSRGLKKDEQSRVREALERTLTGISTWSISKLSRPSEFLALSTRGRLWQGPQTISTPELNAGGIGIQWRRLKGADSALEALATDCSGPPPGVPEAFDGFSCAALSRKTGTTLLTDPLGLFPLCYAVCNGTLFFSSHQTFIRHVMGSKARPDLQAALQFLLIGHPIGERTLMEGVRMIPPGERLAFKDNRAHLSAYWSWDTNESGYAVPESASRAAALLYERLAFKRDSYAELASDPILGFLSGGWDSRLLVALFANIGRISETLTTRQRIRFGRAYVSEELIAREVAGLLGLKNRFVPPSYRTPSNLVHRSAMLDWSTWFHEWAFQMIDEIPEDRYLLLDGLLGDILIRGLFLDDPLAAAREKHDLGEVCRILHERFLQGFNTYTPGIEAWARVIRPEVLKSFRETLWEDLKEELEGIDHPESVSMFFLRNRSRRAIAPLPRLVTAGKGDVHLPFCDPGFVRLALSLPHRLKRNGAIYLHLLELARPGLAQIPSTNEKDLARMARFLTNEPPQESIRGRDERRQARLISLSQNPPRVFASILQPEMLKALKEKDMDVLGRHLPLLEKIQMLESFFG
jgi:hypothetical protein